MALNLKMSASYNALLAILLYILDKKTAFSKTPYKLKQFIIGVLFGLMAIFATTTIGGFDIGDGTIMNVRDAAPLCAGLIFGAPAGIIAGLIGGIYRFVAVYFELAGTYTQIACSVSTILAGFIAAILRNYMFDNKKPTWLYGLGIGMVTEVLHMLMIFFTNMDDAVNAFEFVKICTLPMVIGNGLAVGIAVFVVSLIGRERLSSKKEQKQISQTFQSWLLICIVIAFVATSSFSSVLQTGMSEVQTNKTIEMSLSDVYQDILDESNSNLLKKTESIKEEYLGGATLLSLASKYNVIEVNIIDENGIICDSNVEEYIGYDMTSGEQSNEFVTALLKGSESQYIQDYRPTGTTIIHIPLNQYYKIPYRTLLPKEYDNMLVAGRCLSATHEAHSSVRIMPICACLGEAAGTAAALAHNTNKNAHTVDIKALRTRLKENGAAL